MVHTRLKECKIIKSTSAITLATNDEDQDQENWDRGILYKYLAWP